MRTEWTPEQISPVEPTTMEVRTTSSQSIVYSAEGMNEGALGIVERGYRESTRCLWFRAHFSGGVGAEAACRIIDSYNEFDGESLAGVLGVLKPYVRTIEVGREYSPVIYFEVCDMLGIKIICDAMRECHADEITVSGTTVRAWWD